MHPNPTASSSFRVAFLSPFFFVPLRLHVLLEANCCPARSSSALLPACSWCFFCLCCSIDVQVSLNLIRKVFWWMQKLTDQLTDQVDPQQAYISTWSARSTQINLIRKLLTDQVDSWEAYESSWSICFLRIYLIRKSIFF